jgi:16S rRNA C1402 (ribose-2'-O) methylase RsmI
MHTEIHSEAIQMLKDAWVPYPSVERVNALVADIQEVMSEGEFITAKDACQILLQRVGGSRNLLQYTDCLVVTARRKAANEATPSIARPDDKVTNVSFPPSEGTALPL